MASHSEFGAHTAASTVAAAFPTSIKNKVILITGVANGGVGGATAKALAAYSPQLLVLAGRSSDKVNAVIADIAATHPTVECHFLPLDLSSQTSVRTAAKTILDLPHPLHLLINNAAVMNLPTRTFSPDGIEMQFATNHIGHFLLTNLLLPKLLSTAQSSAPNAVRMINLTSSAHTYSPIRFSDLDFSLPNDSLPQEEQYLAPALAELGLLVHDNHYVPTAAYAQSKTANILFTIALNARLAERGIRSFSVHPGSIDSELQRHADQKVLEEARKRSGANVVRKTLEQGASTTLVAALDPGLEVEEGGVGYLANCGFEQPAVWCRGVKGRKAAERLWGSSERLVGEQFGW
ncbi:hypothetical protein MMC28_006681 [Mycoblastus sanguinarius]|nr:hypothetical protein [Mycoblastus sanguinarius]